MMGSVARSTTGLLSFQGSALERTALEAPPRVGHAFATQEAGASGALRHQAEPGDECEPFAKLGRKALVRLAYAMVYRG